MAMFRSLLQAVRSDHASSRSDGPSGMAFAGAALIMLAVAIFLFGA